MILIRRMICIGIFFQLLISYGANAQKLTFALSSGYQSEDFRWSIAGNSQGASPNIYSELKWKNLSGPVLGMELGWRFWRSFLLRSSFSRLFIVSGAVTDMDYQGDNRTNRSYYGAFDANKGMTYSWRTSLEYPLKITRKFSLSPSLGYALHRQSLYVLSADQGGAAAGLRSTYATKYEGAVFGLRGNIQLATHTSLECGLLYDAVNYRGQANWNLIPTFQHPLSFEDKATGFNLEGDVKVCYTWKTRWGFFLAGNILHSETGTGTDWLYLQNGPNEPTQFNGAVRDYFRISMGARLALF